ncbi:MAG: GNAT family N-acetyltransferase [Candidatus Eremiobacteraeota bacterium]|nr:GNAT family N-acetyltransferase [Candidatus Eremiobacteraeota bacterium]
MSTLVKRVSPDDCDDYVTLLQEYFASIAPEVGEQDADSGAHQFLQRDRSWVWLAYTDDALAGTVSLRALRDDACELKRLYVRPEFRGQCVARALMDAVHECAGHEGFSEVYLDSLPSMTAAHRLYANYGYEPCERYAEEHLACKIFMRKSLR